MIQLILFAIICQIHFHQVSVMCRLLSIKTSDKPLFNALQKSKVSDSFLKCSLTLDKKIWLTSKNNSRWTDVSLHCSQLIFWNTYKVSVQLFSIEFGLKSTTEYISEQFTKYFFYFCEIRQSSAVYHLLF